VADREVFVVGGANSAGQAALHLADYARRVTSSSAPTRSPPDVELLIEQVESAPNIAVRLGTEVVGGAARKGWNTSSCATPHRR